MHRPSLLLAPFLCLTLVLGCRRGEISDGVSDSTYVRTMVALRKLPLGPFEDSIPRLRMRDSVLRHFGLTAAQLESASAALASQPDRAAALWRAIEVGGAQPDTTDADPGDK